MSKTLPEKMADILVQSFANAFKSHNIDLTKDHGTIIVDIVDSCKADRTRVGRAVYITIGELEFSLAIDAQKQYYRPYKDSELDACITYNIDQLLTKQKRVFITQPELEEFFDEMDAIVNEDSL